MVAAASMLPLAASRDRAIAFPSFTIATSVAADVCPPAVGREREEAVGTDAVTRLEVTKGLAMLVAMYSAATGPVFLIGSMTGSLIIS